MSAGIRIRHVVSIAGAAQDRVSQARIGGALVEIISGPPAFQQMLAAQAADPAWAQRRERFDRTFSQADGIFVLVDLPAGAYHLRVSAPEWGSRYGVVEAVPVQVQPMPASGPVVVAQVAVALPPTRIHGVITQAATGQPVAGARVCLRGDTLVVRSGEGGRYALTNLVKGKPTLEVTASGLQTTARQVELAAGQERQEDFALQAG